MLQIYVTCGVWKSCGTFVADKAKGARLVVLESSTTFEALKMMVLEDFSIETGEKIELSFLPGGLINDARSPRVVIGNDRQLKNFVGYMRKAASKHLCVSFTDPVQVVNNGINTDLKTEPDSSNGENDEKSETVKSNMYDGDNDDGFGFAEERKENNQLRFALMETVKKKQDFRSKRLMKSYFEILAMKHNFDYIVERSDTTYWTIRCAERLCKWGVNAVNLLMPHIL
ncbi:unnamed protein product [Microthlaspi erraticum]|uniref:Uncharacterized protein n=1 Tax=Microthlaspi erraticum TaxID=1685480 RepID=A0A6D2IX31_9BRAS|nr:unnamed protein product [Microthlaspi erraticum]